MPTETITGLHPGTSYGLSMLLDPWQRGMFMSWLAIAAIGLALMLAWAVGFILIHEAAIRPREVTVHRTDYEKIAMTLRRLKPNGDASAEMQWRKTVLALSQCFKEENASFQCHIFETACGLGGS